MVSVRQFEMCESVALVVMACLGRGAPPARGDLQQLGVPIDFMLWSLFWTDPVTSGFWSDGMDVAEVTRSTDFLTVSGLLWCADHRDQWLVPLEAKLELSPEPDITLTRVTICLGDAARDGLKDKGRGKIRRPEEWLCQFVVERPTVEAVDMDDLLARLQSWAAENPGGQVVGPDWAPLSLVRAEELLRARMTTGELLEMKPTWLDGGPALHLAGELPRVDTASSSLVAEVEPTSPHYDLVPIAESYFLRLLLETPAKQAVDELSGEWHRRGTQGERQLCLTVPERNTDLCSHYGFNVEIGGHGFLFTHNSEASVRDMLRVLRDVGLAYAHDILGEALALCEPYPELQPYRGLRRARYVSDDRRFAKLDQRIWGRPVYEGVLAYLRAHRDEILRPERGLDPAPPRYAR